jgi:hypothetical protein
MWKNDAQACEVIRRMLTATRLDYLWGNDGPTEHACELMEAGGGPLSHGQAIMLRVAFDLWNGAGKAELQDLVGVLDSGNLRAVLEAVLVMRSDVVAERSGTDAAESCAAAHDVLMRERTTCDR